MDTNAKEAEELRNRLASFPALNPNPIVETDPTGVIQYLNPAAETNFPILQLGSPVQAALAGIETVIAQIGNDGTSSVVAEVEFHDRTYQCVAWYVPAADALRFYLLDVTDRKRNEDQIAWQLHKLTVLYTLAQKLSQGTSLDNSARYIVERSSKEFGAKLAWIGPRRASR